MHLGRSFKTQLLLLINSALISTLIFSASYGQSANSNTPPSTVATPRVEASPGPVAPPQPTTNKLLSPGKVDFQYRHTALTEEYNFILWTPIFKGGAGVIDSDLGGAIKYAGGFVRPLLPLRNRGDLILGVQVLDSNSEHAWEFQGEYRFNFGLGVGAGLVRRTNENLNVNFGKVSYRNKAGKWNYILEAQSQRVAHKTSPGGYGAIYNEALMFTVGTDNEQWRTSFAYIAPEKKSFLRPVVEVLYVDNDIGNLRGQSFYFVNASLKYYGGFLSHPARLGRAMGPTGLEFGNPLGFLSPTWNRRLDVWELGDVTNFRLERIKLPNGRTTGRYETVVFPFQFDQKKGSPDRIFGGAFYAKDLNRPSPGVQGGFFGKVAGVDVTLKLEYAFSTRDKGASFGIIRRF